MENINNIPDQNFTNPVQSIQKQNNIFKYLFFISLLGLLLLVIYFYLNNRTSNISLIEKNNNNQIIPTVSVENTSKPNITASIRLNGVTYDLVLNRNGKEKVIDSLKGIEEGDANFQDLYFTNNLNYLIYRVSGTETAYKIYNLQTNSFVEDKESNMFLNPPSTSPFITNDEKYIGSCGGGEMSGIHAKIISLSDSSTKFDFIKYLSDKGINPNIQACVYNGRKNDVTFFYNNKTLIYNLETGLVNQ